MFLTVCKRKKRGTKETLLSAIFLVVSVWMQPATCDTEENPVYYRKCFGLSFENRPRRNTKAVEIKEELPPITMYYNIMPGELIEPERVCLVRRAAPTKVKGKAIKECSELGIHLDSNRREPLGECGQACVYRIETVDGSKVFAIKEYKTPIAFRREINTHMNIRHEKVVQPICMIENENSVIMEYLDGGTLSQQGDLSEKVVRKQIENLIDAVYEMHRDGFIHSDIKPGNILLEKKHDTEIKLIDLGLSFPIGDSSRGGTKITQAPEVLFRGERITPAIDWWSVGATAWLLATRKYDKSYTRKHPYSVIGNSKGEPEKMIMNEYPSFFSEELKEFISMLLVKDPEKRQFDSYIDRLKSHRYLSDEFL